MAFIKRIFIEKKEGFNIEATNLYSDIVDFLQIKSIKHIRMLYRYDLQDVSEQDYKMAKNTIFSDPPQDLVYEENFPHNDDDIIFSFDFLPGQYDQRADSAAQCIQILSEKDPPIIRTAKVVVIKGNPNQGEIAAVKKFCINPVDSRESQLNKPENLEQKIIPPAPVKIIDGFANFDDTRLIKILENYKLAMSIEDLKHCRKYFKTEEQRDPSVTEIKLLDTYWSDHCRHTTFHSAINSVVIEKSKYSTVIEEAYSDYLSARTFVYDGIPREDCLMDLATIAAKELRKGGGLKELDVSDEINACSIKMPVKINGIDEEWLIMFKNETHNHPTEIEPFGGAATCLGGAIRDPLSGRAYVYQAMRVTGSGDPRKNIKETLPGKLPQRTITTTAARGYSSYGNQIGLATGMVSEIYHEGYVAKRMEIGAVIGAVPAANVNRLNPRPGDMVLLIGGRTGRDGIGGATGSSKAHSETALQNEAEVQKGNPTVERKLQRLFRDKDVACKIKRCNDFGAGGVSVAVGELADSLLIDLNAIPKKYEGLDGTELALSESQERMAVVIDPADYNFIIKKSFAENLEATRIAIVTDNGRLQMTWNDQKIVDLSRSFLNTNGARQNTTVTISKPAENFPEEKHTFPTKKQTWLHTLSRLNIASQKGLAEQFDSTIGARTVLHPYGGKFCSTPIESMVSKLPFVESDNATAMSWGFNPDISSWSPFHGAVYAIVESVSKIVATGGDYRKIYLSFQEYFEKPDDDPRKWGKPYAALLGAYFAQKAFKIAAIGGKDSMSGTFRDLNVPPTLVSFAVAPILASKTISPEFKEAGNPVVLFQCPQTTKKLPDFEKIKTIYDQIYSLSRKGKIYSAATVKEGGIAIAISKMCFGNNLGFEFNNSAQTLDLFKADYGSIIIEINETTLADITDGRFVFTQLGVTKSEREIAVSHEAILLKEAFEAWDKPMDKIFPKVHDELLTPIESRLHPRQKVHINLGHKPKVFITVFPGTNCEYDSQQAFEKAGAEVNMAIFNNLNTTALHNSLADFARQIRQSQILFIPGGFSAGDEPEGSGKFIAAVFRNNMVQDAVMDLMQKRDGLILGICNGFQALIKLGLLPYGEIRNADPDNSPTLTFNKLKRHYSCMVRTKVVSTISPWFNNSDHNEVHIIPVSNGEGRFVANNETMKSLFENGQVACRYVDILGHPTMNSMHNPSGSMQAIEAITSPDGRILGKMAHSERTGINVSKNIPGNHNQKIFEAGVNYFS
jgi:phosphoribosylformylglycinamidine synthase